MQAPDWSDARPIDVVSNWHQMEQREFVECYSDRPAILKGVAETWPARIKWNATYFREVLGRHTPLQVQRTWQASGSTFIRRTAMPLGVFAEAVSRERCIYVAEWYAARESAVFLDDIGDLPGFLEDDWLGAMPFATWPFNPRLRTNIYWGAAGSATHCHFDAANTVTWNATLQGTKRWLLFSGRDFPNAPSAGARRLVECGLATAVNGTDLAAFVGQDAIRRYNAGELASAPRGLTFHWGDVPAGDVIYVPWRWYHQVHNLTLSIAASRYYVSLENYQPFLIWARRKGRLCELLIRTAMGTATTRRLIGHRSVRWLLTHGRLASPVTRALRRAGL
jgi:hypothetical protein